MKDERLNTYEGLITILREFVFDHRCSTKPCVKLCYEKGCGHDDRCVGVHYTWEHEILAQEAVNELERILLK